jgi:hypothetical protein
MSLLLNSHHLHLWQPVFEGSNEAFHVALARFLSRGQRTGRGHHRRDYRDASRLLCSPKNYGGPTLRHVGPLQEQSPQNKVARSSSIPRQRCGPAASGPYLLLRLKELV